MTMEIHHVTPHFYPEIGGLEDSVLRFATWQASRGWKVIVHTSSAAATGELLPPEGVVEGVRIRRYAPTIRRGYFRTLFRPDLRGADIIHLHGYAVRTNDRVVRTAGRVPLVFSLHHGVRMPHERLGTRILRWGYDAFVGVPTLRRVERIIAATNGDVPWLLRHAIPPGKIRVVPTPLGPHSYEPASPRWAIDRVGSPRFVLFLGRIHREKGVRILLETLPKLPRDLWLVYAGPDARETGFLEARARQLGVSERVRFLGPVTEEGKRSLLAACACLCLPSLFEAQGLVVLEAWAQGRPVVATQVGGLADLVEKNGGGLLVPYGDLPALAEALRRIWTDEALAKAMGERGRQAADEFRLERIGPKLDAIYDELLRR